MKIQIRQGCFETNSSSTHAICINTKGDLNYPDKSVQLRAECKQRFGWDVEQLHGVDDKLDYLWMAVMYAYSGLGQWAEKEDGNGEFMREPIEFRIRKVIEAKNKIEDWLHEEGYRTYLVDPKVTILPKHDGTTDYLAGIEPDNDESCWIDHGSECLDLVEGILESKDVFLHYLFCDGSCVCTGNDNDGWIDYPAKSTYDLEFYKGN